MEVISPIYGSDPGMRSETSEEGSERNLPSGVSDPYQHLSLVDDHREDDETLPPLSNMTYQMDVMTSSAHQAG